MFRRLRVCLPVLLGSGARAIANTGHSLSRFRAEAPARHLPFQSGSIIRQQGRASGRVLCPFPPLGWIDSTNAARPTPGAERPRYSTLVPAH